jgi:hypothetical protein
LRENLHVAERSKHAHESSCKFQDVWIGAREERLQGEASARVPDVSGNEPRATLGALPHGRPTSGSYRKPEHM